MQKKTNENDFVWNNHFDCKSHAYICMRIKKEKTKDQKIKAVRAVLFFNETVKGSFVRPRQCYGALLCFFVRIFIKYKVKYKGDLTPSKQSHSHKKYMYSH